MKLKQGYIQVYTGNGKGKTTAALGLALRAAGAGLKVYICQFIKKAKYSEIKTLAKLKRSITVCQCGRGCFIIRKPGERDKCCARDALKIIKQILKSKKYDILILDEINVALDLKLIKISDVIKILKSKPKSVEIILTGRNAPKQIIKLADIATEMREIKHYYKKGVKARLGIEG